MVTNAFNWFNERRLRVTASKAKAVFVATSDKTRETLVKAQLWDPPIKTAVFGCHHSHY